MSVVNGLKGTIWNAKKFDSVTRFSLSISRKNKKTDEWESGYINCVIMNDKYSRNLDDKMRCEIDGNITPNQWQDKENKVHHDIQLWVDDIRFEGQKNEKGNAKEEDDSEPLPFV